MQNVLDISQHESHIIEAHIRHTLILRIETGVTWINGYYEAQSPTEDVGNRHPSLLELPERRNLRL